MASHTQSKNFVNKESLKVCHELAASIFWLFCLENELSMSPRNEEVQNEAFAKTKGEHCDFCYEEYTKIGHFWGVFLNFCGVFFNFWTVFLNLLSLFQDRGCYQ